MRTPNRNDCATRRYRLILAMVTGLAATGGCSTARLDIATADALDQVATMLDVVISEYHRDLSADDDRREVELADALTVRLESAQSSGQNPAKAVLAFQSALERLRRDRETAAERLRAAQENVRILGEISAALRTRVERKSDLNTMAASLADDLQELVSTTPDTEDHANDESDER